MRHFKCFECDRKLEPTFEIVDHTFPFDTSTGFIQRNCPSVKVNAVCECSMPTERWYSFLPGDIDGINIIEYSQYLKWVRREKIKQINERI